LAIERRTTRQKEAIKAVLEEQAGPLLPDDIHRLAVKSVPSLGIATVYRSLKNLQEEGRSAASRSRGSRRATNAPTRDITITFIAATADRSSISRNAWQADSRVWHPRASG
jgi:Fe2+ or Zn2+ uptake regulation protein